MTESSNRDYSNEEPNKEKIVKILPGKHLKLIEEKDDKNSIEFSKNNQNKKKNQCNF